LFLGTEIYSLISNDTSDGLVFLISSCHFFGFAGVLIFISSNFAPFLFTNPRVYFIFPIWQGILSAAISAITSYSTRISKLDYYYKGSVLGWIINLVVIISWVYLRGDWETVVGRMVRVYGIEGYLMVVWPLVSLVVEVGGGVAGAYYWWDLVEDNGDGKSEKKEKKEKSEEKVKEGKKKEEKASPKAEERKEIEGKKEGASPTGQEAEVD